jgi:hypothetical protein
MSAKQPNAYLSNRPYVPDFIDLAHATVSNISHEDFQFSLRSDDEGLAVVMTSQNRHHEVPPCRLFGNETPVEILHIAKAMVHRGLVEDSSVRFRFRGIPVFGRGEA